MWVLISQEDNNLKYTLLCGQDYRVGRADADILLASDKSISRSHAFLRITHLEPNVTRPHKLPILTVTDSSRFGSVVAGEKFKGGTKDINHGNSIKFGTQNSIFNALFEPMVVTTSCLDVTGKKEMKQLMLTLGGHVVNDWQKDCTMLIMSQLSVTVKVICALINQREIVTPKYLTSLIDSVRSNKPVPNPDEFLPPIAESQLNPSEVSFKKDPRRRTLFQGLVFIFLNPKRFEKLNVAIELAGGTPMLMEEGSDNSEDDFLVSPDTRVMSCDPSANLSKNAKEWVQHVTSLLTSHKKRMINDAELGYAVLYCSIQKHCNPDTADGGEAIAPLPSQSLSMAPLTSQISQQDVRVSETQLTAQRARRGTTGSSTSDVSVVDNSFVPDTEKRKSSSGASAAGSPAKSTRSNRSSVVAETPTQKRKREDEDEDAFTAPAPKTSRTEQPDVKKEPVTPNKSPTARGKQAANPRATRTAASASVKAETLSDNDEHDGDLHRGQKTTGRTRHSPSPAPEPVAPKTRNSPARRATKVEIDLSQDVDAMFDSMPTRGRRRRNRSPTPEPQTAPKVESPKPKKSRAQPTVDANADFDDAFNSLPARGRGRRGRSPSPDPEVAVKPESAPKTTKTLNVPVVDDNVNIDDAFDNIPSRRSRRTRDNSPTPSTSIKGTESQVPNRSSPRRGQRGAASSEQTEAVKVKAEPVTPAKPTSTELRRAKQETYNRESDVPVGFLTAARPIEDQRCIVDKDYKFEAPADVGVTCVEEASLVVASDNRKRASNKQTNLPDGTSKWKGRIVKNFKKFRKTSNAGANGLPRIIGGADLLVHRDVPNKEREQWLIDLAQAESQQNEQDEIAKQLFDWEPSSRRNKAGRR